MRKASTNSALRITLVSGALAGAGVLVTHWLFQILVTEPTGYRYYDLFLDIGLGLVIWLLLYLLLRRELLARESAEAALRKSQEELELRVQERTAALAMERARSTSILEAMEDGVCIVNRQQDMEYINPALERQFGPVTGRKCYEYFNDRQDPCPWCRNKEVFAGQTVRWEWQSAKTGKTYDLIDTPLRTPSGEVKKLEILRDVTDQRRIEQERERLLHEIDNQRQLFQAVAQNALVGIAVYDGAERRLRWANPFYRQFLDAEYQTGEIAGRHLEELVPRAAAGGVVDIFRQVARTGQPYVNPEYEFEGFARGITYWQWSLVPLPAGQQAVPDLMVLANDITPQVLARKRTEELGAEAERRTEELRQAHGELELRTRELATLLDISHKVASILESRPLLEIILDQLRVMIDYTGATVFMLRNGGIAAVAYRGPVPEEKVLGLWVPQEEAPAFREVLHQRQPLIIDDLYGDAPLAQRIITAASQQLLQTLGASRAWMGIPLMVKDRVIGLLRFDHLEAGFFTARHAQLALTIANQAAVAIENAQLHEQAQKLAALDERQRLARTLHDSVSQALYGIALGTHAASEMLVSDPGRVPETLNYVLGLAETAVTEMRQLIFELRPESLQRDGLISALTKLGEVAHKRYSTPVHLDLCAEPELPLDAKEALYRIAQEALYNAARHAQPKAIHLRLCLDQATILLEVSDDGIGFDPAQSFPDHLGLQSMRERAAQLGGTLEIDSVPGHGTLVRAAIPARAAATAPALFTA